MSSLNVFKAALPLVALLTPLVAVLAAPPNITPPSVPVVYSLDAFREAVRSGGPGKDGIPSIDQPRFQSAAQAEGFLRDEDIVIGVYRHGEARAYPQRILVWHEIVNDEIDGEPLSITYCPLTGTALGFRRGDTELGVSGNLVNSNLVMYDRATDSAWPQILGVAIDGELAGRGLEEFRLFWTTWERWKARHPETRVLTDQTGYVRNYRRDPYGSYHPLGGYYRPDSRHLFPVMNQDGRYAPKEMVFGLRTEDGALAIDRGTLREESVIETRLGDSDYVVIHDPGLGTGWAFQNPEAIEIDATALRFGPEGVSGPGIEKLEPVNAFEAMWFAWAAFYPDTAVYE
ncbi:DUF3179 domain-containing protein [Litchfieldella rifensis]|uniref:DUF3179 domain-containing protein n=1 Tax=Litchfieldella rifensis TaxID=762643 RepID=A0ABV7LKK0_9GAMM